MAILVLSLFLQSARLDWGLVTDNREINGLPAFHISESNIVSIPYTMMQRGDLNAHHFIEPSMFYNSMFVVFTIISKITGFHSFIQYILIARIMSILFTVGVVFLVYLTGKEVAGVTMGLYAALLMAMNPYYLWFSSIAKEDPMMVFMITLSMYLFAKYISSRNQKYFFLAMAAAGFAASTKYPGGLVLPFLLFFYFMYDRTIPALERSKTIARSMAVYVLAFVAGTPFSVITMDEFLKGAAGEFAHYTTYHPGFLHFTWFVHLETITGLWDAANIWGKNGYGLTLILLLAGSLVIVSGIRRMDARKRYIWFMLLGWIFLAILVFGFLIKIKMGNQMMIMTPATMVIGGFGLERMLAKLRSVHIQRAAGVIIIGLIFTYAVSGIISSRSDNRYYAAEWFSRNVDPDERVATTLFVYLPDNFKNISLLPPDIPYLEDSDFDYIVLSSWEYQRYIESPDIYPKEADFYNSVLSGSTLYKPAAAFECTETSRQRTLNFGLRALTAEKYGGEVDIHIFRRSKS
ncbi:Dolichyl-phosphate-mannose-protein mannosyltransferase [uncultured archaeon]|nr:Dolichyl-phosphate-mannose-protein mannosyltransferase [uncultured archaeon]